MPYYVYLIPLKCANCGRKYQNIYWNAEDSKAVCAELAFRRKNRNCDIHTSLNKCILLKIIIIPNDEEDGNIIL
jgi:hypothetical protein